MEEQKTSPEVVEYMKNDFRLHVQRLRREISDEAIMKEVFECLKR